MATRLREDSSQQLAEVARQLSVAPSSAGKTPKRYPVQQNVRKVLYRHTPAPSDLTSTLVPEAASSPVQSQESYVTALGSDVQSSPLQRELRPREPRRSTTSSIQEITTSDLDAIESDTESNADNSGTYSNKKKRDNLAQESEPNADGFTYCLDLPEHWPEYLRFAPTNDPTPRQLTKVWDVLAKHIKYHEGREWYLLKMWGTWVRVEYAVQWLERDDTSLVAIKHFPHGVKILIDWELTWSQDVDQEVEQTWRSQDGQKLFIRDKGKGFTIKNQEKLTTMGIKKLMAQAYKLPQPDFDEFFDGRSDYEKREYGSDEEAANIALPRDSVWNPDTLRAACKGLEAGARRKQARGKKRALPQAAVCGGEGHREDASSEALGSSELGHVVPTTERPVDEEWDEDRAPSPPRDSDRLEMDSDEYIESDDEPLMPPKHGQSKPRMPREQEASVSSATQKEVHGELKSPERKRSRTLAGGRRDASRSVSAGTTPGSVQSLPTRPRHQAKETPVPLPANFAAAASYAASRSSSAKSKTPPSRARSSYRSPCVGTSTTSALAGMMAVKEEYLQSASSTWGNATKPAAMGQQTVKTTRNSGAPGTFANASSGSKAFSYQISTNGTSATAFAAEVAAQQVQDTQARDAVTRNNFATAPHQAYATEARPPNIDGGKHPNSNAPPASTPFARFDAKRAAYTKSMLPTPVSVQPASSKNSSTTTAVPGFTTFTPANDVAEPQKVAREVRSGMFRSPPRAARATRPEGSGSHTTHQESMLALRARVRRDPPPPKSRLAMAKEALEGLSLREQEQLIRDVRSASRDGGALTQEPGHGFEVGEVEDAQQLGSTEGMDEWTMDGDEEMNFDDY